MCCATLYCIHVIFLRGVASNSYHATIVSRTSEIIRVDGTHVVAEVPETTYADSIDLLVEGQKTYTECSSLGSHNQRFGLECC